MTKVKKKLKLKKPLIIILLLLIIIIGIIISKYYYDNTLKEIKNNYHKYVITTKNTKLYNKNKNIEGTIYKNAYLELDDIKIKGLKNRYFKIKNTDYYISYKNIKKSKKKDIIDNYNYLMFNTNIKTNKKVKLYDDKKLIMSLDNGINTPLHYIDKNNYYIKYLNRILKVKKNKTIKEINKINTKEKETAYISVLHYEVIDSNCTDYECVNVDDVKKHLDKLKGENYSFINLDEYKMFTSNYMRLKEKSILLTTSNKNDLVKKLEKDYKITINDIKKCRIKFKSNNKKSIPKEYNRYEVKSYTTLEEVLKMALGEDIKDNVPIVNNTSKGQGIAVLNYHFFYDSKSEKCNEVICLDTTKFREQLDYLKENNYKVLTMKEFKDWMYGKKELPEKSVLLTIDDGAMGTGKHNGNKLIPILEEYKIPATLFLIAGWWDINNYKSKYLTVQSHTYDMHDYGSCGNGQINCVSKEEAKKDLQKSIDIIGNRDSFCFPFYYSSKTSIEALKELDFKLAFVGENRKATRKDDKYKIPRYVILNDITMKDFIKMVN